MAHVSMITVTKKLKIAQRTKIYQFLYCDQEAKNCIDNKNLPVPLL